MSEDVKDLMVRFTATTELLRSQVVQADRLIADFSRSADGNAKRVEQSFKQIGAAAGQQKAGLQQLSYQIGDISTMYAMGAKPMQIFASQMGQVLQAVQLSVGGTSKFAAFLGGPWGMALTAGVVALTPFISKLFDTADAADTATNALEMLTKKRRDALADQNRLADAEDQLNEKLERRKELEAEIAKRGVRNPVTGQLQFVYKQQQELAALRKQIEEDRAAIDRERVVRAMGEAGAGIWGGSAPSRYQTPRVTGSRSGGGSGGRVGRSGDDAARDALRREMERMELNGRNVFDQIMSSEPAKADLERIDKTLEYYEEARREVADRLAWVEEQRVQQLASIYERAFTGGVKAIWDDFESMGKQVIARVLAEFTMSRINGGGGFDLGKSLTGALAGLFGGAYADGGRPPMGRVSLVGERGPELFVPDAAGTIIPNHALGGGAPNFYISMPNASAETVMMVRREIANAAPALVAAASGNTVRALNRKSL